MRSEVWAPIPEFAGLYEASSFGRIRSIRNGIILKVCLDSDGYPQLCLKIWGRAFGRKVHRLVAAAFLGEPTGRQVNHKDGVKTNNTPGNLEYVTNDQNIAHGVALGLFARGERNRAAQLTEPTVREIRKQYVFGSQENSTRALARRFKMSQYAIHSIVSRRTWVHI